MKKFCGLVCANSRTPAERRGDLAAQVAANETGIRRFQELVARYGLPTFQARTQENLAYAAEAVRQTLARLPAGTYHASDVLDDDGTGATDIPIVVTVTIEKAGRITFDFTGSAAQVQGSLNATEAITRSACYYLVRCLVEEEIPTNEGCFAPVEVIAPLGNHRQCPLSGGSCGRQCRDLTAHHRRSVQSTGAGDSRTHSGTQSRHNEQSDHRRI